MKLLRAGLSQSRFWHLEAECVGFGLGFLSCGARWLLEPADIFIWTDRTAPERVGRACFKCGDCGIFTALTAEQTQEAIAAFENARGETVPTQNQWKKLHLERLQEAERHYFSGNL